LITPNGFTRLAGEMRARPDVGVCSAGVRGIVGNPRQLARPQPEFRVEPRGLAFICVCFPRAVLDRLGLLDERFVGYGFEDNDYCERVRAAGLQLGIWDGCVVDHSGELPSTFRTRPDLPLLFERGRQIYREKWGRDA
jgi:GT2 family glycosyltransferase